MDPMVNLKTQVDGLEVEYEILPPADLATCADGQRQEIALALQDVDAQLKLSEDRVAELDTEIERLTNHADGLDYTIAVASGVICGILDSVLVGELGIFKNASPDAQHKFQGDMDKTHHQVNNFIENYAKTRARINGESSKVTNLTNAIKYLEDTYPVGQDNTWKGKQISSSKSHHLDDLAHHPTMLGLLSAIIVQYLRISVFVDKNGKIHPRFVATNAKDLIYNLSPAIFCGLIKWVINMAERSGKLKFDDDVPQPIQKLIENLHKVPVALSVLKTVDNWFAHLVSDMGGSKNTAGGGAGIPGLFASFLKEISTLPGLKNTQLPQIVNDLYQGTKASGLNYKLDMRAEITIAKEQGFPIIVNEIIVRVFYFVRRLTIEAKYAKTMNDINWSNVIPIGNRTVERMMTIASGTFMAVDMADAAAHAATKSAGNGAAFLSNFVLRVNFVGVGRFAIAVGTDVAMGMKRSKLIKERMAVMSQELFLLDAKVYYGIAELNYAQADEAGAQADANAEQAIMWRTAEDTVGTLAVAYENTMYAVDYYQNSLYAIYESLARINGYLDAVEQHNPGLRKQIENILKWGKL